MFNKRARNIIIVAFILCSSVVGLGYLQSDANAFNKTIDVLVKDISNLNIDVDSSDPSSMDSLDKLQGELSSSIKSPTKIASKNKVKFKSMFANLKFNLKRLLRIGM